MIGYINWTPEELKAEAERKSMDYKKKLTNMYLYDDNLDQIGATHTSTPVTKYDVAFIKENHITMTVAELARICCRTQKKIRAVMRTKNLTEFIEPESVQRYRRIVRHSNKYGSTISHSGKLLRRCRWCGHGFLTTDISQPSCKLQRTYISKISGTELVL